MDDMAGFDMTAPFELDDHSFAAAHHHHHSSSTFPGTLALSQQQQPQCSGSTLLPALSTLSSANVAAAISAACGAAGGSAFFGSGAGSGLFDATKQQLGRIAGTASPKKRKFDGSDDRAGAAATAAAGKKSRTGTPAGSRAGSPVPFDSAYEVLTFPGNKEDPEMKRHTHNVLERKRRNDLKTSYNALRAQIPGLIDNDRAPTGQILSHAVDFIVALQVEDEDLQAGLALLRADNERLRRELGLC
jgi:hypothetical protein